MTLSALCGDYLFACKSRISELRRIRDLRLLPGLTLPPPCHPPHRVAPPAASKSCLSSCIVRMPRTRFGRATASKLLAASSAVFLSLWGAGPASATLIAESSDSSSIPIASANGWLYSPRQVRFVVTSQPSAALDIQTDIQCSRGRFERRLQRDLAPQIGPVARSIRLSVRNAESCYIDVTASYDDIANQAGAIKVQVFGRGSLAQYRKLVAST